MTTTVNVGGRWRSFLLMLGAIDMILILGGCASSANKSAEPQTGSLIRTCTLVNEQGHNSGTLVINPLGGAELMDASGNLIGTLVSQSPASRGAIAPPEGKPEGEK